MARVMIVGAGLTGCTLAHRLAEQGIESILFESEPRVGGLIRSEHMHGVLFEPHGSHIFHTEDREVWNLANAMTPFRPYRHRVDILIEGRLLNWPILLEDIGRQTRTKEILAELEARRHVRPEQRANATNFEQWCLELMGPILYERYVRPYTEKQWGRPPAELSAQWAPRRVQVRWDNDPYLFSDPFQGWPAGPGGYTDLVDGLLAHRDLITIRAGCEVSLANLDRHVASEAADVIVLTCPLDVFTDFCFGRLEWRGILVNNVHIPHIDHAQGAMVVNYPGSEYPFIRVHEAKHASGQQCEGTVLGFEFTGAPARHYPIETVENRVLNERYQAHLRDLVGDRLHFAGRLANYVYIDMDDCMRQALDTAEQVASSVGRAA